MKVLEATLIMPMTILIVMLLISFMMHQYNFLLTQTDMHENELAEAYSKEVIDYVLAYEKTRDVVS